MRWSVGLISIAGLMLALPVLGQVPSGPSAPPTGEVPPTTKPDQPAPTGPATSPSADLDSAEPPLLEGPALPSPPPPTAPVAAPPLPTPPPQLDLRPNRKRRPFFIGGELGWNGLSGLGVNFSYHPDPHLALDTGAGLSLTGWRVGLRVRGNILTGEWTPFLGAGVSYATGLGDQDVELESKGEKAKLRVLPSPFAQFAVGANYTGREGFVFTATTGYSLLLRDHNTSFQSGSAETYDDTKIIYDGGLILSVAFGYAF